MERIHYLISSSSFGEFGILWYIKGDQPRIIRLTLPGNYPQLKVDLRADYPLAEEGNLPVMEALAGDIRRFLEGKDIYFDTQFLAWEECTDFQVRVLRAEYGIPRGWVSTYGRIARKLGLPGGARAVGSALAINPFPILIPCHRAVRSSGELGGYQGGLEMKKALLEMEGVRFRSDRHVSLNKVYY